MMDKQILYRFSKMELNEFATFEENYKKDNGKIDINCLFAFSYNFEQNVICCSNTVSFTKEDSLLLKAKLDAFFAISESSVKELYEGESVVLPEGLQAQFASLAYGTLRGIIFAKTLGTALNNIILPPNDILSVINKPVVFER